MKTKEQIKEEYDKYELQEEAIKNKVSLDAILEIAKNDLFENVRVTTKEKRANKIEKLKSRILNLFSFFTETENQIEIYDEDNEILDNFLEFCSQQNIFLTTMEEISSDTNYQELAKLYEFIKDVGMNDLHDSNVGRRQDGSLVIIDYSGFEG